MNTQEKLIEQFRTIYENCPFIVTYKEPEKLEFLYSNKTMLNFVGCQHLKNIIGKTDYDFKWEKFAFLYERHERDALQNNIYPAIYPGCNHEGLKALFMCHRTPFFDDKKDLIGVLTHTYELSKNGSLELNNVLNLTEPANEFRAYTVGKKDNIRLTAREKECLFYFVRGKTCKMIGKILNISHRTVEKYIEIMKYKFNSHSKNELISSAIERGYLYDIPANLLNKKFSTSLKEK